MPIAGKGMLLTSMDVDAVDEADFNRWYDREHLEERVAIEGFIEARRYVVDETPLRYLSIRVSMDSSVDERFVDPEPLPKYLSLYSTQTFDVLDSPAYREALANQTDWSKTNIARFKNMIRAVARITISRGQGRGAVLGIARIRPVAAREDGLRAALQQALDPKKFDGVISMHLIESDPALSKPLTDKPSASTSGAADWFMLIDATTASAASSAAAVFADEASASSTLISSGTYRLMWDLSSSDIPA